MATAETSGEKESVFVFIEDDYYRDPEKKRLVVTTLENPPINFVLQKDLPRLGILYGDINLGLIATAEAIAGVRSITREADASL